MIKTINIILPVLMFKQGCIGKGLVNGTYTNCNLSLNLLKVNNLKFYSIILLRNISNFIQILLQIIHIRS